MAGVGRSGPRYSPTRSHRLIRLMHEYVASIRQLAPFPPSVAIFGSARTKPEARHYAAAVETARLLAHAGFGIITGGGTGLWKPPIAAPRKAGRAPLACPFIWPARNVPMPM